MKKLLKSAMIAGIIFLLMMIPARAEEDSVYLIREEDGFYTLYKTHSDGISPLFGSESLNDVFDELFGFSGIVNFNFPLSTSGLIMLAIT